jgi:hypothetical protein
VPGSRIFLYIYYVQQELTIETAFSELSAVQKEIIRTILYFDVFNYPLTREELYENSPVGSDSAGISSEIDAMVANGLLNESGPYLMTPWANSDVVARREKGNDGARKMMPVAFRFSRKIASFPFVEGVFLSGGLSKNYFAENSDVDYFIVTRPGRLWICRTLLILRYKLLPKKMKKFWCVNYFISSDNLNIPDVNRFTATELAFLIPAVNFQLYRRFLASNDWYREVFPNKPQPAQEQPLHGNNLTKRIVEYLLSGMAGEWLDKLLLRATRSHWQRKFPQMPAADFDLQLRSRRDVCKRHTTGFQQLVLSNWQKKQQDYASLYRVTL